MFFQFMLLSILSDSVAFQPVIARKVKMACNTLGPFASACRSAVDKYLPEIITWLENGDNEKMICQRLMLCDTIVSL